jgi:hypothetical protein
MFDRDWIAGSTTAMGITGDARLTPTSITFDRRVTYKLRYVSEIATAKPEANDGIRQFSLFEFVDPKPQALSHGAQLCRSWKDDHDDALPRYLAAGLSHEPEKRSDFLLIVVFRSERPPEDAAQENGLCGELLYFRNH